MASRTLPGGLKTTSGLPWVSVVQENCLSFAVSFALHLLAAVALVSFTETRMHSPLGQAIKGDMVLVELGTGTYPREQVRKKASVPEVTKKLKEVPSKADRGNVAVTKPVDKAKDRQESEEAVAESESQPRFGTADGASSTGRLGDPNGYQASERQRYVYELQRYIESRKVYPPLSQRFRETGKVKVGFTILEDGSVTDVAISGPSEFGRLNEAAKSLIQGIGRFKAIPSSFGVEKLQLEIPIEYVLK